MHIHRDQGVDENPCENCPLSSSCSQGEPDDIEHSEHRQISGFPSALIAIAVFLLPIIVALIGASLFSSNETLQISGAIGGFFLGVGGSALVLNAIYGKHRER